MLINRVMQTKAKGVLLAERRVTKLTTITMVDVP